MGHLIRITLAGMLLATLLGAAPMQRARADGTPDSEPGQIVVKLAPLPGNDILGINEAYGTTTLAALFNHEDIFLLQAPPNADAEQLVWLMASDPRLGYAELNYINSTPEDGSTDRIYGWGGQESSHFHGQNATTALELSDAHAWSQGEGTLIAVLDTGVQLDHPKLVGSLDVRGFDFVDADPIPEDEANGADDDGDGQVDEMYGHGTHVAGIVHLVAPEALIMPVRILNSDGRGNNFRTANAILYAASTGADAINLSLGVMHPSDLLRDAVAEAARLGVVVVAAAGNLNSSVAQYPAADACAIAVTSVNVHDRKSSFANYGDWIDLAAFGENIYSTFPTSGYAWASGTSVAVPFVAGQAALLRSANPELALDEMGLLIGGTARSVDRFNPLYRGLLGEGRIDILASLEAQAAGSWLAPEHNLFADCSR
ncbi:MAG TPA: S8 family serine peptidase [Anaerolineae bacterium]|nr:S8 family serine peptidase [Anaerolineae bacterium]